jgi:hypothetical protein
MKPVWKDVFVDGLLDEGRLDEGRKNVLHLLEKRFGASAAVRGRVEGCLDIATIDLWFDRAITAKSVDEVFGDLPGARLPLDPRS